MNPYQVPHTTVWIDLSHIQTLALGPVEHEGYRTTIATLAFQREALIFYPRLPQELYGKPEAASAWCEHEVFDPLMAAWKQHLAQKEQTA